MNGTNSQNIFLIDGLGALLTAFLTRVVMTYFSQYFGMPEDVLYILAGVACLFAIYSLSCHFLLLKNWRPFLLFIVISNTIYCLVSIGFVVYHFANLTTLGIVYFLLEILVIGLLVFAEFRLVVSSNPL